MFCLILIHCIPSQYYGPFSVPTKAIKSIISNGNLIDLIIIMTILSVRNYGNFNESYVISEQLHCYFYLKQVLFVIYYHKANIIISKCANKRFKNLEIKNN